MSKLRLSDTLMRSAPCDLCGAVRAHHDARIGSPVCMDCRARLDAASARLGSTPAPAPAPVEPTPWHRILDSAPLCARCGKPMEWRHGISQHGRAYCYWACPARCSGLGTHAEPDAAVLPLWESAQTQSQRQAIAAARSLRGIYGDQMPGVLVGAVRAAYSADAPIQSGELMSRAGIIRTVERLRERR